MTSPDYLIYAMASGETSQAYAVIRELQKQSIKSLFVLGKPIGDTFLGADKDLSVKLAPTTNELKNIVEREKPKKIVFFNSKSFRREIDFIFHKPSFLEGIPCSTLDSNWLFENSQLYPSIRWADQYYVNFPKALFQKGLKENGGYFSIMPSVQAKIQPVGFIPSYQRIEKEEIETIRGTLGITPEQKLIFCYFSGYGATARYWVFQNLIAALDILNDPTIRVVYSGDISTIPPELLERPYLLSQKDFTIDGFFKILSASNLIFQHQGLATMAQGIAAQVPIIANVASYPDEEMPYLHRGEIEPFEKLGLCRMHERDTSITAIAETIKKCLYDTQTISEILNSQIDLYSSGEKTLIHALEQF